MTNEWPSIDYTEGKILKELNGNELLLRAVNLMHEEDTSLYEGFALTWVRLVIADLWEVNNELRVKKNLTELSIPMLVPEEMITPIPLEPELEQAAVYGVLLKVYADESDTRFYDVYTQKYEAEKAKYRRGKLTFVSDGVGW